LKNLARFRGNLFQQRGAVDRFSGRSPGKSRVFGRPRLARYREDVVRQARGLVLVTVPPARENRRRLRRWLDKINSEREEHMITIEDRSNFCTITKDAW